MSVNSNTYFDLLTTGTGFIQRFRKITPEQGDAYYSVTIAALRGKASADGKVSKTYIDCNICGEAVEMAKQLEKFFENAEPKVLIGFTLGDLEQRAFQYKRGEKKGQTGFALKARLFDIKWFKVNGGDTVYSAAEIERKKPAPMPSEVKLVKDDPYYDQREKQLIEQGYSYIGGGIWSLAGAA